MRLMAVRPLISAFRFQLLPIDRLGQSQQFMFWVQLVAQSRFEQEILILNNRSWLHDDFPDFETKDNTKTCKIYLGFSGCFYREKWVTSGPTNYVMSNESRKIRFFLRKS
jgi:hypothetical protein